MQKAYQKASVSQKPQLLSMISACQSKSKYWGHGDNWKNITLTLILLLSFLSSVLFNRDKRDTSLQPSGKAKGKFDCFIILTFSNSSLWKCSSLSFFGSMLSSCTRKSFQLIGNEFWTCQWSAGMSDCHHLQFFFGHFLPVKTCRTHIKTSFLLPLFFLSTIRH